MRGSGGFGSGWGLGHPMSMSHQHDTPAASASLLDNPIWHSLATDHARFALGDERARRFIDEIGPLSGMPEPSEEGFETLRGLVEPGRMIALFLEKRVQAPEGWTMARDGQVVQMLFDAAAGGRLPEGSPELGAGAEMRRLTAEDAAEMVALAELTEPGPFRMRTIELGQYYGIFAEGRLASMAGQRPSMPGYMEVSAVCTHPEARGRGYARALMERVMEEVRRVGKTPFLHVWWENESAIRLYERMGYRRRHVFELAVLQRVG